MLFWRLAATHFNGTGSFVRFFMLDVDIGGETQRLEEYGWLCECDRVDLAVDALTASRLRAGIWPNEEDSELTWLAGNHVPNAAADLATIAERQRSRKRNAK